MKTTQNAQLRGSWLSVWVVFWLVILFLKKKKKKTCDRGKKILAQLGRGKKKKLAIYL